MVVVTCKMGRAHGPYLGAGRADEDLSHRGPGDTVLRQFQGSRAFESIFPLSVTTHTPPFISPSGSAVPPCPHPLCLGWALNCLPPGPTGQGSPPPSLHFSGAFSNSPVSLVTGKAKLATSLLPYPPNSILPGVWDVSQGKTLEEHFYGLMHRMGGVRPHHTRAPGQL